MADYNIYIHSASQYDSPTTPLQLRDDGDISGAGGEGASGGSGFGAVRRAAAFFTNPDSAIGQVAGTAKAAVGSIIPFAIAMAAMGIAKKVADLYVPFVSNATGDYAFQIKYDNFFQSLNNITHPFSTELSRMRAKLEEAQMNKKSEQQRLLFGGTIYDSRYGRYL